MQKTSEQRHILTQIKYVAEALGETFAPFCEVVVHDLSDPQNAIVSIHNNLSSREVGDPTTEIGLARIDDPDMPQIMANYPNKFNDGRQVKSTSIGIKDSDGNYIAALCLNIDITIFQDIQNILHAFSKFSANPIVETIDPFGTNAIRARIDEFAASKSKTPRTLKASERRELMRELRNSSLLEARRAMETVALHLGVSKATVYADAK
ncbi:transcriptional regulator [Ensifer sp. YR511]|uniref:helix-turn-helix transcriptional regulator n=1 Tax=Ensifer sp. YR511 TaxID=1855294 RepID=UPI00088699B5|nr:helix-turn-helix transcriptional regulator [Ensifer sp. YR511]SDN42043.1 Predicted transcriptional regulator YheO, contains PAS and DNA-binding HTH domains [Ensifer sp. YR511]